MTPDIFIALLTFAFASSVTPGPNNLMLMASGANYGLRRTLPHMLGISLGHMVMVFAVGVFLLRVFSQFPALNLALKILSVTYMLWLAWRIATALPQDAKAVTGTPLTFLQAAAFQWVNPKAWFMAITARLPSGRGSAFRFAGFWARQHGSGHSISRWPYSYSRRSIRYCVKTARRLPVPHSRQNARQHALIRLCQIRSQAYRPQSPSLHHSQTSDETPYRPS